MDEKRFVCIACPMGCPLRVYREDGQIKVEGNTCKRGLEYGTQEFSAPMRTVTSSVPVKGVKHTLCSVKTSAVIPKERVEDVLTVIRAAQAPHPVHIGDVIVEDVLGLGVDVVATRNVE